MATTTKVTLSMDSVALSLAHRAAEMEGVSLSAVVSKILRRHILTDYGPAPGPETAAEDIDRFLGSSPAVVAVESGWFPRIRACRLYCYRMPAETFTPLDECAGYWVSRVAVEPADVDIIDDLLAAILKLGAELRFVPDLWPLSDAVVLSTLRFSLIRMRNAAPRRAETQ